MSMIKFIHEVIGRAVYAKLLCEAGTVAAQTLAGAQGMQHGASYCRTFSIDITK
jgi:hypothetical protein